MSHPGPGGASGAAGARGSRGGNRGSNSGGGGGSSSNRSSGGRPGNPAASNRGNDGGVSRGGNSNTSGGGGRPTNPAASDRGRDGGVSRGGSSSGGSDSIRGASKAKYSFNSPEAGEMKSFRSDRQMARSLEGTDSFGGGTNQGGVANGQIAGPDPLSGEKNKYGERLGYVRNDEGNPVTNKDGGYISTPGGFKSPSADMVGYMSDQGMLGQTNMENGLNKASPGYRTVVGDIGITDQRAAQEAMMNERAKVQPDTRTAVERAVMDANNQRVASAQDDGVARGLMESVAPFGGLIGLGMDINDNRLAAEGFNDDLGAIQNDYSIQDGYFGAPDTVDANSAVVGDSTGGLLGNPNRMADVALGIEGQSYNNSTGVTAGSLDGPMSQARNAFTSARGGGGGSPVDPNTQTQTRRPPPKQGNGFGYGRLTNYGSYKRRLFQNL